MQKIYFLIISPPSTTTSSGSGAPPGSPRRSFSSATNATEATTSSVSDLSFLPFPKALGSAPLVPTVTPKNQKSFPLVQTKIIDFFRIKRSSEETLTSVQDVRKKRKRGNSLAISKKKRELLPFVPSEDPKRRLEQMASLATALTATNTVFSNELTYIPGMAPRSANCPALESDGMQVLSKEDTETLNLCRTMMKRGECPPLIVVFDPLEGFIVEADRFIRDLTIITEYVGDVDFLKNRKNDDGDSMMTLLSASNPSQTLVI